MEDKILQLQEWVDKCKSIVFFGGAGVSTESGIPDFRSVDGLYNQKYEYPPESMCSHGFFKQNPEAFFRFYKDKFLFEGILPNAAHLKIAELEKAGKLKAVVTQNVDGLHQAAGSKVVYELHGAVHRNYCMRCGRFYDEDFVRTSEGIPTCTACGGTVKPDVVLFGEGLDDDILKGAIKAIMNADMLIIGGTSLAVWPAAGLIDYYHGNKLVLINKGQTPCDHKADLVLSGPIGEILSKIAVR